MDKKVEENRKEFYSKYYDLFEDGTLREIYNGEKISVYAVAEKHYGVVPFTDRFPEDSYMFLNINEVEAKMVVQDEEFFLGQHRTNDLFRTKRNSDHEK